MTEFLVAVSLMGVFMLIIAGWLSERNTNKRIKKLDDRIDRLMDKIGK